MADIFISYAREDEGTAQHLRDVLASQGWDVWRDKEGIVTRTAWGASIEQAYEYGRGVPADLNIAMQLYKRASDLGERNAVSSLSRVQERLRMQGTKR